MLPRFAPYIFCRSIKRELELALIDVFSRALQGKRWYQKKFGENVPNRRAAIPGLI